MISFESICNFITRLFERYYVAMAFNVLVSQLVIFFFHMHWIYGQHDLLYFRDLLKHWSQDIKFFTLWIVLIALAVKSMFLALLTISTSRTFRYLEITSTLEHKKRYGNFIFLRLLTEIDSAERKYYYNGKHLKPIIKGADMVLAYNEIWLAIDKFRYDAEKIFTPNETHINQPAAAVYSISEEDYLILRKSRFFKANIQVNLQFLRQLLYAKSIEDLEQAQEQQPQILQQLLQ